MERSSAKQRKPRSQSDSQPERRSIVFFHPDLGIGGAERLVIDAAVGLQDQGSKVTIFTSHCDRNHCFDEARDGTLDIRVRGNWLFPATFFGRFKILFSILRHIHLLCAITRSGELAKLKPAIFFIDQLAAGIPFLRWFWEDTKIIFYCHFPDLLLVQGRKYWYKRIWRIGFDWIEGWGMRGADRIVVNSNFTKGVVEGIWKGLGGEKGVGIVYPCVDTTASDPTSSSDGRSPELWPEKKVILSINRFERKKNIGLALRSFAGLSASERGNVRLVLAGMAVCDPDRHFWLTSSVGGYDVRVAENVTYHKELESLAESLKLRHATAKNVVSAQAIPSDIEVLFLLSIPNQFKSSLLRTAKLLLYTPSDEHFGIVPLEAMLAKVPVLASNSGGPLETVVDNQTGWLRSVDHPEQWTEIIQEVFYQTPQSQLSSMGQTARQHVLDEFSKTKMASRLEEEIDATLKAPRQQATEIGDVAMGAVLIAGSILAIFLITNEAMKAGDSLKLPEIAIGLVVLLAALVAPIAVVWKLMQNESAFT